MRNRYSYSQYIWEREEWPRFEWDAERLLGPLGKLSHAHGQLSGRMSMLGFSEQSHAMTDSLASDLINSSEIEGGEAQSGICKEQHREEARNRVRRTSGGGSLC